MRKHTIDFAPEFAPLVKGFFKRSTVRPVRKSSPIKPGDELHLFSGQRSKNCLSLGVVTCQEVVPLSLGYLKNEPRVLVNGVEAIPAERLALALTEGFPSTRQFIDWYRRKFLSASARGPWKGVIVKW